MILTLSFRVQFFPTISSAFRKVEIRKEYILEADKKRMISLNRRNIFVPVSTFNVRQIGEKKS